MNDLTSSTLTEHYTVRLDIKKRGGYWQIGHIEHVDLPADPHGYENAQHDRAAKIAASKYPGCEVVAVTHC